jgi:hypothetical protein
MFNMFNLSKTKRWLLGAVPLMLSLHCLGQAGAVAGSGGQQNGSGSVRAKTSAAVPQRATVGENSKSVKGAVKATNAKVVAAAEKNKAKADLELRNQKIALMEQKAMEARVEAKLADYEANYGTLSDEKREILKQELTERFKSEQSTPSNN